LEQGHEIMNQLVPFRTTNITPVLVAAASERAQLRFLEFFTANLRNRDTRRAYTRAVCEFLAWCNDHRVSSLMAVQPMHVASYVEQLAAVRATPTVKQRLAAIRHLFDWLFVGQIVATNPADSVRGPTHIVKKGKTPVLYPKEARRLLESIDVSTQAGLRDRALIGLMIYSFARIGAALAMKVEDVYIQNRRLWVRLHEKGGKRSTDDANAALDRIEIPQDVVGRISQLLTPGSSLIVSDDGLSRETGDGTDFIVVMP
jgi:integrase/recombinase XerC